MSKISDGVATFLAGSGILAILCYIVLLAAGFVGWCFNIYHIFVYACSDWNVTANLVKFIASCAGVPFFPLGAIFGWVF